MHTHKCIAKPRNVLSYFSDTLWHIVVFVVKHSGRFAAGLKPDRYLNDSKHTLISILDN